MEANEDRIAPPLRLRPANDEDIKFIFNSWLKSFRDSAFAYKVTDTIYYSEQHKTIERLLQSSHVIMAVNDKEPSQIYGYICANNIDGIFCLHFIYVKQSFRNFGIGRILLNAFEQTGAGIYTHKTRIAEGFTQHFNLVYHPYILVNGYVKAPSSEEE